MSEAGFIPVNVAVLTVSDTRTLETDTSGKTLADRATAAGHHVVARTIVPDERDTIRQMFDRAARDVTGFDEYAHEVVRLLGRDPARLRDVLEGLFHIAAADGILHPEEERHLARAAEAFGISRADFRSLRGLFVHDPDDPYTVLGLSPDVDDATLKSTFKRLVRQHHPDVLAGHGASPEFVRLATAKLAEINAAFDRIVAERAG